MMCLYRYTNHDSLHQKSGKPPEALYQPGMKWVYCYGRSGQATTKPEYIASNRSADNTQDNKQVMKSSYGFLMDARLINLRVWI
jgi:hypothetical protein